MQEELRRLRDVTRSHLDWLLDVDGSQPLTTDDEAFTAIRTELLTQYKNTHYATTNSDTLVHDFVAPRISNPIGEAIVALNKTSLRDVNVKEADLPKLLPEDGYFPALNVMANVCAYYQGTNYNYLARANSHNSRQSPASALLTTSQLLSTTIMSWDSSAVYRRH